MPSPNEKSISSKELNENSRAVQVASPLVSEDDNSLKILSANSPSGLSSLRNKTNS